MNFTEAIHANPRTTPVEAIELPLPQTGIVDSPARRLPLRAQSFLIPFSGCRAIAAMIVLPASEFVLFQEIQDRLKGFTESSTAFPT